MNELRQRTDCGPIRSRRLIVNADDFGRSSSINQAVVQAHRDGILTSASLMVSGDAVEEAVCLARQYPSLGIGLHLTLVCGRAILQPHEISGLVNERGAFRENAVQTGIDYFFRARLRKPLEREIGAQFQRFQEFGLTLDHVNGHLNLHLHPTVFDILMRNTKKWGISRMRLTREPFFPNARAARGRWFYRLSHWLIFGLLSWRAKPSLRRERIRHTRQVFGLLQNGEVDVEYLSRLLVQLPEGDSELYSHPSLDDFRHEFEALTRPEIRALLETLNIQLIRYQDL